MGVDGCVNRPADPAAARHDQDDRQQRDQIGGLSGAGPRPSDGTDHAASTGGTRFLGARAI